MPEEKENELCKLKGHMWSYARKVNIEKEDGYYSIATERICSRCLKTERINQDVINKIYAKCYLLLNNVDSYIGKIREECLHFDQVIMEKTTKLYELTKEINDYIYEKLP